jgi:hypothetical protein
MPKHCRSKTPILMGSRPRLALCLLPIENVLLGGNSMKTKVPGIITTIALALLVSIGFPGRLGAEQAEFRGNLPYPDVADTLHATDRVADIFGSSQRRVSMTG